MRSFVAQVRGQEGEHFGSLHNNKKNMLFAMLAWIVNVGVGSAYCIALGEFKTQLQDGTTSATTVILWANVLQLGFCLAWWVVDEIWWLVAPTPGALHRCTAVSWVIVTRRFFVGALVVCAEWLTLVGINASNPTFVVTLRLILAIVLMVGLRFVLLQRGTTTLHVMMLGSLVFLSLGFAGLQSDQVPGDNKDIGAAVGYIVASAAIFSWIPVYLEATESPPPAKQVEEVEEVEDGEDEKETEPPKPQMSGVLRKVCVVVGSTIAMTIAMTIHHRGSRSGHNAWEPWGGPGPLLSILSGLDGLSFQVGNMYCGVTPFMFGGIGKMVIVHLWKTIYLKGKLDVWAALVCASLATSSFTYLATSELMTGHSQAAVMEAITRMEAEAAKRAAAGARRSVLAFTDGVANRASATLARVTVNGSGIRVTRVNSANSNS